MRNIRFGNTNHNGHANVDGHQKAHANNPNHNAGHAPMNCGQYSD